MTLYEMDKLRYRNKKEGILQIFLRLFRAQQNTKSKFLNFFYKIILLCYKRMRCLELPSDLKIDGGWYIGHAYCITIDSNAVIGKNFCIHKGATIGQENRGKRKGTPVIRDNVWVGVNATIVGGITVGDDVLIAPNTYVNQDIPSHSIVYGNPCIIKRKENATDFYVTFYD